MSEKNVAVVGNLTIETFDIQGPQLITNKLFPDDRGFFTERFKTSGFAAAGIPVDFKQDNFSVSKPGVLRGLHYQWNLQQGKLVTCTRGHIFDVAVDIRAGSTTFGKVLTVELRGDRPQWLWIPAGFAHGFQVLGNSEADVFYKCDNEYNPQGESGIRFNDPELAVRWPGSSLLVSPRDEQMASFADYRKAPRFS